MNKVNIIEAGEKVGEILIPDSYQGSFWRREEICCPCNYIKEDGDGILYVYGRYSGCDTDCEFCDHCDFLGNSFKLPKGSIVKFF